MDKPKRTQKSKRKILSVVFVTALVVSFARLTLPVDADAVIVTINNASYGTLGSFNVVRANLTNDWVMSLDLVVFAVWKNTAGQTVGVSTGGLTLASGATGATFAPLLNELPTGSYSVGVFVVTTNNNPVSFVTFFSVVF